MLVFALLFVLIAVSQYASGTVFLRLSKYHVNTALAVVASITSFYQPILALELTILCMICVCRTNALKYAH